MITGKYPGLKKLFEKHPDLKEVLYYNNVSKEISAEDPKFMFYASNTPWNRLAKDLGFTSIEFSSRYDVALSFAGQDRDIASKLFDELSKREREVFYDFNEQDRIIGQSVENYLMPIYRSEATLVVPIISEHYPKRVWTQLETEAFRGRFSKGAVVPVRVDGYNDIFLHEADGVGGLNISKNTNLDEQIKDIADILCKKLSNVSIPTNLSTDD